MLKDKNANVFVCLFMSLVYQMTKLMFPQYSEWAETWSSLRTFSVFRISLCDSISRSEHWGDFSPHASAPRHLNFTPIKAIPVPSHTPNTVQKTLLVVLTPKTNASYVVKCSLEVKSLKSGIKQTWIQIPALQIPTCLTFTKLLKLST